MKSSVSCFVLVLFAVSASAQEKYSLDVKDAAPPKEVDAAIAKLMGPKAFLFKDSGGKIVAEVWIRAEVPSDGTAEQIKNGITYREVKQTELLGVVNFPAEWHDYRKQKVPAGAYTLRLAYQPMDGDHMGMGEFQDYALLLDASKDTSPKTLEKDALIKMSMASIKTGHPGVLMLVPTPAKGKDAEVVARPRNEWVLNVRRPITSGGKKADATFAIGLTLEGHAE
ncbi:MAG: hypothetical protein U0793_32860 [Gemmataceae bacterium]